MAISHKLTLLLVAALTLSSLLAWGDNSRQLKRSSNGKNRITTLERALKKRPNNVKLRLKLGSALYKVKKYNDVIQVLAPHTPELPTAGLLVLADAFREKNRYEDEVRILKMVVEKDPTDHHAVFALGHAYWSAKMEKEAVSSFRRSIELKPNFKLAYDSLLNFFVSQKNQEQARYEARIVALDITKRFKKSPEAHHHLCRISVLEKFAEESVTHCKSAIKQNRRRPDNYAYLADAYSLAGDEVRQRKTLHLASKRFPKSELAQRALGNYYFKKANYPTASRFYIKALAADSKSSVSHLRLAESEFESKHFETSLKHYNLACKLDNNYYHEFRNAVTKLNQANNSSWAAKFRVKLGTCRN